MVTKTMKLSDIKISDAFCKDSCVRKKTTEM